MKSNKNRRTFLKHSLTASAAAFALPHYSFSIHHKNNVKGEIVGHGDFKYKVNKEWGIQDTSKIPVNDCHEMVQDAQGRIILLTNHTKNNIICYDQSGKVKDTWTLKLPGAHGLTIATEGSEQFLFITDSEINKVYKTTMEGKVLLELDYPKEVSDYKAASEFKPTEVAVAPNGDFYVADGYGQNFIIQYNQKGEYIRHFGGKGEGITAFDCCHGVCIDQRNNQPPTLLITSRSKQEFKRFTLEGDHIETYSIPGCWICRPVIKGDNLYFAVIVTKSWWAYDGMVAVLDSNNQVVSLPGGTSPTFENDVLQAPEYDGKTFLNPHDVCIDQDENIYVSQWYSGKTYPIKLERI
jgi:hypothetical protein